MSRRRGTWACAAAAALTACGLFEQRTSDYGSRPGPNEAWVEVDPQEVREVQRLRSLGDGDTARAWIARLTQRQPEHLGLRFLRQDVELDHVAPAELLDDARELAVNEPELGNLLAVARLESDSEAARVWIELALDVAPQSAWPHYALAHREALDGNWVEAGERLERALAIDPGHLPARRLETMLLARGGDRDDAIEALRRWMHNARRDPLQSARQLDDARLDLAQLLILAGDAEEARTELAQLLEPEQAGARVELVFAGVEQAQGRPVRALDAARAAGDLAPDRPLAAVQEALLQEEWLNNPAAAREAWERVLVAAGQGQDLSSVLLGLRARAALERLDAQGVARKPETRP